MLRLAAAWATVSVATAAAGSIATVDILAAARGQVFKGIGAISGGGATSALLRPYPEEQRSEILDLLFKPSFAAALPILKVEIGGDAQTTDGTESSHRHTIDEEPDYTRGYEWWLMKEAKKRNPDIELWGLPWAFPGWVDATGSNNPYSNVSRTAEYVVDWVRGAEAVHNLTINMVGCWNERPWNADYLIELRKQLDAAGFSATGIIAADGAIDTLGTSMLNNSTLMEAVSAFGMHYPGMVTPASAMEVVNRTGKPVFASEDYGVYFDASGGKAWARLLNQNAVRGYMSGTIAWNLVSSYYQPYEDAYYGPSVTSNPNGLPFRLCGLMHAAWPWSGYYQATPQLWVTAHHTHFVKIGWRYLPVGSGTGLLEHSGSFVSLVSPDGKDLTVVIEKMSWEGSASAWKALDNYTTTAEPLTLKLEATFAGRSLAVWKSVLHADDTGIEDVFIKQSDVKVSADGSVTIDVCVDCLFTVTTMTSAGHKGSFSPSPPAKAFPLPHRDDFDHLAVGQEADFFQDQAGVWEGVPAPSPAAATLKEGTSPNAPFEGMAMRQMVLQRPVCWAGDAAPISIIGSSNFTDIVVSAKVLWEQQGCPWIAARVTGSRGDPPPPGPHLDLPAQAGRESGGLPLQQHRTGSSSSSSSSRGARSARSSLLGDEAATGAAGFFTNADGVIFAIDSVTQTWVLAACMSCVHSPSTAYAHGALPAAVGHIALNTWHALRLEVSGTTASGSVDGHSLFSKVDVGGGTAHAVKSGYAAIGLANFTAALFDDFSIEAAAVQ